MRFEADELDAITEGVAQRLLPRLLAEIRKVATTSAAGTNGTLLSVDQLAERLNVSAGTIRNRVADGSIPARKLGNRVLFDLKQVLEAMEESTA